MVMNFAYASTFRNSLLLLHFYIFSQFVLYSFSISKLHLSASLAGCCCPSAAVTWNASCSLSTWLHCYLQFKHQNIQPSFQLILGLPWELIKKELRLCLYSFLTQGCLTQADVKCKGVFSRVMTQLDAEMQGRAEDAQHLAVLLLNTQKTHHFPTFHLLPTSAVNMLTDRMRKCEGRDCSWSRCLHGDDLALL